MSFIDIFPSQLIIFFNILLFCVIVDSLELFFLSSIHSSITFSKVRDSDNFSIFLIINGFKFFSNNFLASSRFSRASFSVVFG